LNIFSVKAPKIDETMLKKAIIKQKGCQISTKLSKTCKNNQIKKNTTVNFEKTDKKVNEAKGAPP